MTCVLVRPDTLCAWKGSSLLIVNTRGECAADQGLSGYYYREARFLRTLRLQLDGHPPWLCEATAAAPDTLRFTYVHPEVADYGGGGSGQSHDETPRNGRGLPQRAIIVRVTYTVGFNGLTVAAHVENRSREPLEFELAWDVAADFADIQEAQSAGRSQHAPIEARQDGSAITFRYQHPDLPYIARLQMAPGAAWEITSQRAAARVRLSAAQSVEMGFRVVADGARALSDDDASRREQHVSLWRNTFTSVGCPGNRIFEAVLAGNVRDFASFPLCDGEEDEWLTLQAGVPLYPALFGRDAMTAGWQAASIDRGAALDAALTRLQRLQSRRVNDWRDEEPGRIPYQVRSGPLALLNMNPYAAYYADFASPLMFVISLTNLYAWTGDDRLVQRHWDSAQRIMEWARDRGEQTATAISNITRDRVRGRRTRGGKTAATPWCMTTARPCLRRLGPASFRGTGMRLSN